jgi:membrane-associated phospholipid phosphatase
MAKRIGAPAAAWLACAASLVLLTLVAYGIDAAQRADARLLARISSHEGALESIAGPVAHLADPLPLLAMLLAACAVALFRRRPLDAIAAATVVAGANVTTQILKIALAHPRYQPVLGSDQLGPVAFPSGHATAAASIAIAWLFVVPREWLPLTAAVGAAFAAAVGLSIVVLAWHFPSDALGGYLVAAGWGFAVLALTRAWMRPSRRSSREHGGWPASRGSPPPPPVSPSGSA